MATELVLNPRIAQWTVQAMARLLFTFGVLQGANICVGGQARWSAQAFHSALVVPGAPASWGVALALLGLAGLAGSLLCRAHVVTWAAFGSGAWCLFFAMSFAKTAIQTATASTTGVYGYGVLAVALVLVAIAYRSSARSAAPAR